MNNSLPLTEVGTQVTTEVAAFNWPGMIFRSDPKLRKAIEREIPHS
jgi:hypothetical protein